MNKLLILLFLTFTISGAIFGQVPNIEAGVSNELAKWRAANYSDARFNLDIKLEKMSPTIEGTIEISLFNKGDLIILDWRKLKGKEDLSKISKLSVNGREAYFEELRGHLILKEGVLKNRPNTIKFDFTSPIADGAGVKRFVDKEDGAEYVSSQFSANSENTAFPAFDQTDLKTEFQLDFFAPKDWKIVTNTRLIVQSAPSAGNPSDEREIFFMSHEPMIYAPKGLRFHRFFATEPISIHAFAFAAGEFAEFKDIADIGPVKTAPIGSSIIYEPRKNPNAAKIYVRESQAEKFGKYELEFFRSNRKTDKSAKLDIILLPEISNVQSDYDGIKFLPESAVFK